MAASTIAATCCSSVTSVVTATALPPASCTRRAVSSSWAVRRAASTSDAPSALNIVAMTRPRPSLAPVMITTLSSRRPIGRTLLEGGEGDRLVDAAKVVERERADREARVARDPLVHRRRHHDLPPRPLLDRPCDHVDQWAEVVAVTEQHRPEPHRASA